MPEKSPEDGRLLGCDQEPPQRPKASRAKLAGLALLIITCLSLLNKPITHCYHEVSQHVCGKLLSVDQRARRILAKNPLIDGHVDFPGLVRMAYRNKIESPEFKEAFENGTLPGHVDLRRLRDGQVGGTFWSVYAPCPEKGDDFSDENLAPSVQFTLDQIDVMNRLQAKYPKDFSQQIDSADALPAFRTGQLISPLGAEGLHQIGNKAANLRQFHSLGVRYVTLTHNCHNNFADAAILEHPERKAKPLWNGVSPLGRQLVKEMNRIGMIVDLAHVSEDTMVDVLGGNSEWHGSEAPIIFSHSSAWSICPHPRNVKDHVLELVKERNSVVMVNAVPDFISCEDKGEENGIPSYVPANATIDQVVKHITYIGDLIGYDHVGIGTDFDGIAETPRGLEDVSKYPDLIAALLRNGVSDRDAAKVAGGNVLRVWREVDAVAAEMQAANVPAFEDDVPQIEPPEMQNRQ